VALRRSIAKEWFAKAEESEASGDRQAAIRRYACSLSLAPHPSTAYNLGTVAEKSGDLSAALDGFRTYLKLAPEATDRPAIEARIAALDARVAELRKEIAPKAAPAALPAAPQPPAAVAPGAAPPPLPGPSPSAAHRKRTAGLITGAGAAQK
jgi:predicted TPR repeat methyltransferase